jgi:RND family efflux transporter MFP subunit
MVIHPTVPDADDGPGRVEPAAAPFDVRSLILPPEAAARTPVRKGLAWIPAIALGLVVVARGSASISSVPRHPSPGSTVPAAAPSAPPTRVAAAGYIVPSARVRVSATSPGRVDAVLVSVGDNVRRGDRLMTLDPGSLKERVREARANVEMDEVKVRRAASTARRARQLWMDGLLPPASLELADADLSEAEATARMNAARLAALEADLARTVVHAPFDGIVTERSVEPGQVVGLAAPGGPGTGFIGIDAQRDLMVEIDVPQTAVSAVAAGDSATVTVEGAGEGVHACVVRVYPSADRGRGTVRADLRLGRVQPQFRPDMSATVTLSGERCPGN